MTASELIHLIDQLHRSYPPSERTAFYQAIRTYRFEEDYDWQDHMNDPAEEGIIMSGVYLAWAQDWEEGIHLWDTDGNRYLLPKSFTWLPQTQG